jgi:hypothetical protein
MLPIAQAGASTKALMRAQAPVVVVVLKAFMPAVIR